MAATKKTDNHYTADKIALRAGLLPDKKTVRVLDAFGGRGIVWAGVARKTGRKIERVAIDKRLDIVDFHLHGDNVKIMAGLDLTSFDVIDLDSYGIPVDPLLEVFSSRFKGVVFITAIQTMMGVLPKKMLMDLGFPMEITKKAPTLAARHGWEILKEWLALNGVREIIHRSKARKHYFGFIRDAGEPAADYNNPAGDTFADRA